MAAAMPRDISAASVRFADVRRAATLDPMDDAITTAFAPLIGLRSDGCRSLGPGNEKPDRHIWIPVAQNVRV
jgi:hypothetical protein